MDGIIDLHIPDLCACGYPAEMHDDGAHPTPCDDCQGRGAVLDGPNPIDCRVCGGSGVVLDAAA